jgi:hypothetical protein
VLQGLKRHLQCHVFLTTEPAMMLVTADSTRDSSSWKVGKQLVHGRQEDISLVVARVRAGTSLV